MQAVKLAIDSPRTFGYEAFNICDRYSTDAVDIEAFLREEYPEVPIQSDLNRDQKIVALISPEKAIELLDFQPCEDLH